MQKPRLVGVLDSSTNKVGAGIVLCPGTPEQDHKHHWLKLARAWRSEADWQRVFAHRAAMSAHLNHVVELPPHG